MPDDHDLAAIRCQLGCHGLWISRQGRAQMERFRELPATIALAIGSIGGFLIGGSLGMATDRGIGLIAVAGALLGAGAGTWLAQSLISPPPDEEP